MTDVTTRDELVSAGLDIVRESGLQPVLPDFTVRELIDRSDGPTRSAFQHAWPQRSDYEADVLEEVLAERALSPPASLTSVTRALDLLETGPDLPQFCRYAYLNADGPTQRRDLRDRIAVTCVASGRSGLADFARQSETARQEKANDQLVSILRLSGVAFGLEPREGFTFLDLARGISAATAGMLLHRIANVGGRFTDYVFKGTPGWSLEAVTTNVLVDHMSVPLAELHQVPVARKPHPSGASRPAADVAMPMRQPTTRSLLLDAGVAIVKERGPFCGLPAFTVSELLDRVSSPVTEGAFHHSWPRKIDFENELMVELITPDVERYQAVADGVSRGVDREFSTSQKLQALAHITLERPFDPTFMYLATLLESGDAGDRVVESMAQNFALRSKSLTGAFATLGSRAGRKPTDGIEWEQIVWVAMAITDGMHLRRICEPFANELSLERIDPLVKPTLLGHCFEAVFEYMTQPV